MTKTEADYLEQLVAFPSVSSDKKASKKCADFCAKFFKNSGMHTTVIDSEGYPSVVATSTKTKTPKILLQAHMDVVPAKANMFTMKKSGSKLMGRGAFDMKFACASYMKLLDKLGDDISSYDFGIMLTFDEEIGGHNGVEALLDQGYGGEVCILPDSGKNWHLESTANGVWWVKLSKKGKNAHASLPKQGINSAEILINAMGDLYKLRQQYNYDDLTLSPTHIEGGKAINQIPDYAEATLDIRYRNESIYNTVKAGLDNICEKHGLDIETVELGLCMSLDTSHQKVVEFIEVAEKVLGHQIPTAHSVGATDARFFCARDVPCVVIQPNGGGRHSKDEWVDKKGVEQLTEILRKYIAKYGII